MVLVVCSEYPGHGWELECEEAEPEEVGQSDLLPGLSSLTAQENKRENHRRTFVVSDERFFARDPCNSFGFLELTAMPCSLGRGCRRLIRSLDESALAVITLKPTSLVGLDRYMKRELQGPRSRLLNRSNPGAQSRTKQKSYLVSRRVVPSAKRIQTVVLRYDNVSYPVQVCFTLPRSFTKDVEVGVCDIGRGRWWGGRGKLSSPLAKYRANSPEASLPSVTTSRGPARYSIS